MAKANVLQPKVSKESQRRLRNLRIYGEIVGRRMGITIRPSNIGTGATDGKSVMINYGAFSDNPDSITLLEGISKHEFGHIRYTDFEAKMKILKIPMALSFYRALEDARMEMRQRRDYPGMAPSIEAALGVMIQQGLFGLPDDNEPPQYLLSNMLLAWCRSQYLGQKALSPMYESRLAKLHDVFGLKLPKLFLDLAHDGLIRAGSTSDVVELALQLEAFIKKEAEQATQPQPSQPPEPDEGEEGDDAESGESKSDEQSGDSSDDQDADGSDEQSGDSSDDQDADGSDEQSGVSSDDQDADGSDEQSGDSSDDQDADGSDEQSGVSSDDQDADGSDEQSGDSSNDQDADGSDEQSGDSSDDQDADGSDEQSGVSSNDQDGGNAGNQDGNGGSAADPDEDASSEQSGASGESGNRNGSSDGASDSAPGSDPDSDGDDVAQALKQILDADDFPEMDMGGLMQQAMDNAEDKGVRPRDRVLRNRNPLDSQGGLHEYEALTRQIELKVASQLEVILESRIEERSHLDSRGGKLSSRHLVRVVTSPVPRVFKHEEETPGVSTAVSVLLDISASMGTSLSDGHTRMHAAVCAARASVRAMDKHEVPCSLHFFGDSLTKVKSFDEPWRKVRDLTWWCLEDNTLTAQAIEEVVPDLAVREEARKLLLVVTDGIPADPERTSAALQECKLFGVEVGLLLIADHSGRDHRNMRDFKESLSSAGIGWIEVSTSDQLADGLIQAIKDAV
jgi:hypothetical protein